MKPAWLPPLFLAVAAMCGASVQAQEVFAPARARGELRVGVPALAPAPLAGAKVRTPEGLAVPAAARLAARLNLPLVLVEVPASQAQAALTEGRADVVLAEQTVGSPPSQGWISARVSMQPKAVIRSDTPLRIWPQVAGKRVCMAQSNLRAQTLAVAHDARVQTYRAPSDALVAVREGQCDIALIDGTVWTALMRFPEWRKFSSTLPADGPRADLGWLTSPRDTVWLQNEMRSWQATGAWTAMAAKWARDVAFDVYLDQEVPDCHG
ncbi:transporter substrate-binding domain-containing protein [Bordetella holmesii]|uniref:ABC transporter, substrate-binding protein, family 3 n=2 Tax=Bordetella holmesii TaxID=35814 RepID=A0A158M210_9BORD|nr:transporter substrate-binding domain-containing protein [Bordetella holmesii]AHV93542.1 bacterial extracellular solute-binding s, 3 family protein [Bordetella holmesii ATCC 51541]AIT28333.1 bacterial extracellular solute-binding s, 3 family protein [Bordetella holmesii 44057]EWM41124.1 bacterial extracellular solute-binding s, 3 family protein [Bordetella holmesii 35009]EWM43254.1 bacterial extracellular solute-binding s, 3 family protein [Bordetella holmesii 41130]EWM45012.1 bacterial extr